MVVMCDKFPFEPVVYGDFVLSDFQQWAIKAIKEGDHVLVTAHTGSGKTLPAEFAIEYFTAPERKKKVIYASPIKALSNQKLYDMRRKFPHISFGILTGDCKDNPDADVLIMTTEILRNKLLKTHNTTSVSSTSIDFAMDFDTELAAVVFDEVHYINDIERGSVWEQAILLLPPQVQLIMLSATIDKPEEFAGWIEREKKKTVYLASTHTRVVPLSHYMWLSVHEGSLKKSVKTPYEAKMEAMRRMPILIASSNGNFREDNFYKVKDVLDYLQKNNMARIKRQYVLTELLGFLKQKEMLPAICFLFSRKHVEQAAAEINFSLLDEPNLVEQECRHILQAKLPNYAEYMELPEYAALVKMLQKGIAIHHAGIIPVLREMVELLFEKGFIRLLIATETFAVGINMPTKTVIFAGLTKFNGNTMRLLFPHEYTQMAGRAGRRGKDVVGHVFHCVNLFELPTMLEYKHMLTGPPQTLTSKFKISFNTALALLEYDKNMSEFMSQSLLSIDLRREIKGHEQAISRLEEIVVVKQAQIALCRTPQPVMRIYKTLFDKLPHMSNSDRKMARKDLSNMEELYRHILPDLLKIDALKEAQEAVDKAFNNKENTVGYVDNTIMALVNILTYFGFAAENESSVLMPTLKGRIAAQLQETHPLAMADLYLKTQKFESFSAARLAGLFSCFYPVNVSDEYKTYDPPLSLRETVKILFADMTEYMRREESEFLNTGAPYELQYDLMPFVITWCDSGDEASCKHIIQDLKEHTGLFLGEFIKALLKVNAIAQEFERVCEITQDLELLQKLREIPALTLKYIATSQSLYI